jgi:hypothetical protein
MACPFLLAGFDARQVGALPRRPRLPSSRATGAAFFAEIVHRTISDRSSPPGQARVRASPRQARPDFRRQAWGTPLACGLKPSGNRTVKTLHRSVFSPSSARAVSSLAARFPERFSPIVLGLHPVTPTSARRKTALRCFHRSSSCSGGPAAEQASRRPARQIRKRIAISRPGRDHGPMRTVPASAAQASARHVRDGRWPVALGAGGCGAGATQGRGDGPGQTARRSFLIFHSANPATGLSASPGQGCHVCNSCSPPYGVRLRGTTPRASSSASKALLCAGPTLAFSASNRLRRAAFSAPWQSFQGRPCNPITIA